MTKHVRDTKLETRAARSKLKAQGKPYFKSIGEGLHLGYRKGKTEGKWVARTYVEGRYITSTIGMADDFVDADGSHVLTFFQAQDKAREAGSKLAYVGPYRVKDAIADYVVYLGDRRGRHTGGRIGKHIGSLADELVESLTSDQIRRWLNSMVKSGKDPEVERKSKLSANRVLTILKSALLLAFRENKVSTDSAIRRVQLFKNVVRARTRYLSIAECERLINASEPEFRTLVRGALETGARYGELGRMTCGDFNPDAGTIHVLKSKSGRERHIILSDAGAKFFRSITAGKSPEALMFAGGWKPDNQNRRMKASCENARMPYVNFHQLRHTWASHSVMAGMPLTVVAKNLGHVSTKMVEAHYGHLAPSYVVDQVRKFAPTFGAVSTKVRRIR
jgi:integrase